MSYAEDLRSKLVEGIHELESEIERLHAAVAVLEDGKPAKTNNASPRARAPRQPRRRRAAPVTVVVPAGKISSLLKSTGGITTADLARQTNGGHEQILTILKELEADGKAHRSGARRSTRWHAGPSSSNGASARGRQPVGASA